jgi:hypothetical protein
MRRVAVLTAFAAAIFFFLTGVGFSQAIENEFYLITPVSKDVHDPMLKAFAAYAKKKMECGLEDQRHAAGDPGGLWSDPGMER